MKQAVEITIQKAKDANSGYFDVTDVFKRIQMLDIT